MQTDPIFYEDQMNMYAYVHNDPMNFTDPSGMESKEEMYREVTVYGNRDGSTDCGCQSFSGAAARDFVSGVADAASSVALNGGAVGAITNWLASSTSGDNRTSNPGKSESPVWKGAKPDKKGRKTNGETGKDKEVYEWDHTHNDIEVYDARGRHKGSMDPTNGEIYKPPVKGRKIDI